MHITIDGMTRKPKPPGKKGPAPPKEDGEEAITSLPYLRKWRELRGMTQDDLGDHVGLSQSRISQLETGDGKGVPLQTVYQIAKTLNTTVAKLIEHDPDPSADFLRIWEDVPEDQRPLALRLLKQLTEKSQ